MAVRTIALNGSAVSVTGLDGTHAHIRNDGTDVVYASKTDKLTAGADGVLSIPAGSAASLYGISGQVVLLGTGSAVVISSDYPENPFKLSTGSGGQSVDETARTAINTHIQDKTAHIVAEERTAWNSVEYSNPNLLINTDFTHPVNQRGWVSGNGQATNVPTIDMWKLVVGSCNMDIVSGGIHVYRSNASPGAMFFESVPLSEMNFAGKTVTLSGKFTEVDGVVGLRLITDMNKSAVNVKWVKTSTPGTFCVTALVPEYTDNLTVSVAAEDSTDPDGCVLEWIKLELGDKATPYTPPIFSDELSRCQRFYQIRTSGDVDLADLRPSMASIGKISQLSDGKYAYIADV